MWTGNKASRFRMCHQIRDRKYTHSSASLGVSRGGQLLFHPIGTISYYYTCRPTWLLLLLLLLLLSQMQRLQWRYRANAKGPLYNSHRVTVRLNSKQYDGSGDRPQTSDGQISFHDYVRHHVVNLLPSYRVCGMLMISIAYRIVPHTSSSYSAPLQAFLMSCA